LREKAARHDGYDARDMPMRADGPFPGQRAVAVVDLRPNGVVRLGGEEWSATSAEHLIAAGTPVEVIERIGLRLTVRAVGSIDPATPSEVLAAETSDVEPVPSSSAAADAELAPLTAREREVAALIARGLTNRQIAEELVVAETTVDRHVSHILAKLDFATRAQVAVWFSRRRPGQPQEPR
jgi:DNA-binding CsgD family transcriptional regulator